ncbi:RNA-binding protein NOB1 [Anthonomus grandis grandis]|uniref:RNA-binding protein NOB1 n=1 Tax=Anthonomus grandis grandis TaxID=2921223 RepID=UPI002165D27D|nr:RNA-binding protein NOB1 [Anthonomus grandis grandis]
MINDGKKHVEFLVVDTTAFIQNAPLHDVADVIITCQDVVDEITNKRQLRRLVALPYDLVIKDVFTENIKAVTEFSKKTGDYPSLSATDIKVMALTYQLEKEKVGTEHLRTEPVLPRPEINTERPAQDMKADITGFFLPGAHNQNTIEPEINDPENKMPTNEEQSCKLNPTDDKLASKFEKLDCDDSSDLKPEEDILVPVSQTSTDECFEENSSEDEEDDDDDDDNSGWITPSNLSQAKKQVNSQLMEEKNVSVACMTTDFAMQNVLRQMNLNVAALDGRIIKQLRTYVLRCYACFKITSIMTKKFCPKCGNNTLKKVAVSVGDDGKMQIHINPKRQITGRGKKYSLPKIKGGKHPNNPILVEDQPMADNRPTRLAKMKNNPLDDDYIAGFSPFVMRDVNSKSAQLGIRPGAEFKQWMKKNPNESRRRRK